MESIWDSEMMVVHLVVHLVVTQVVILVTVQDQLVRYNSDQKVLKIRIKMN